MKVSELHLDKISDLLKKGSFLLRIAQITVRIKSDLPVIARDIAKLYSDFEVLTELSFSDFHIAVMHESSALAFFKSMARFYFDGKPSATPLPAHQAFAMFEWGLNWCIAAHCHQYLIIHAAVIEKNGMAAILPAPPGSGKSTLCAGLVNRGWRLLSDELALYDFDKGVIFGMARPTNLKNRSIEVIKEFAPDAVISESVPDTAKGTVALMRPPSASVARVLEPAIPRWIVLPKYAPDSIPILESSQRAETFMLIAEQSFNYDIHGYRGFQAVRELIDKCSCYQFTYSHLCDAERIFSDLLVESA